MRNFKKGYIISYYTVYYIYIFKTENTHSLLTSVNFVLTQSWLNLNLPASALWALHSLCFSFFLQNDEKQ